MKTLIENIIYCQTACLWTVYLCTVCKNICQASLPLFLLLLLEAIFCLDQCQRQSKWKLPVQQLSIFVTGRGGNSMTHKHRVMAAAVKLHLNATYAQHLALKSVYEKRQYVMGGKLFSVKDNVWTITCLWTSQRIACMRHLLREALTICQDRVFASFRYVLLSSVLRSC